MGKQIAKAKDKWISDKLGSMNLEQKVGQLMVFGFAGPVITPDVVEIIKKYHVGGLRISQFLRMLTLYNDIKPGEEPDPKTLESLVAPSGLNRDFAFVMPTTVATASEYAATLNTLRSMAFENNDGIPLHYTVDMEGSGSDDLLGGQRLFPHPMGIAATRDPQMGYKTGLAIALQATAVGANMIHSPLLDVNTNPKNPEVGSRAYSDNAEDVIKFASKTLKGLLEGGLIATGKHFPGRGESAADAHFGLPLVDLDYNTLMDVHIAPYKALIKQGLPAIMSAHSIYPALGDSERPASLSRRILVDFLRGELGFKGVITTDNMMMGGILKNYEMSEAIVEALIAGNDLILTRDESPIRIKILNKVKDAVKSGRLKEKEVDQKIQRILAMRWDMGIAKNGGLVNVKNASKITEHKAIIKTAVKAAQKSVILLRDNEKLLPIKPKQRILLVEQIFPSQLAQNNMYSHPGLLWEEMCRHSSNVMSVEIHNLPTERDRARVDRRIKDNDFDMIVTTNYYYHKAAAAIGDIVRKLMATGKPVVVMTNTPYEFGAEKDFPTVLVCFNPGGRENMAAVADILYGKLKPTAKVPVSLG